MSEKQTTSRRAFLKGSVAAGAGAALASQVNVARMAHAAGSDELKIVLIGCGGRGNGAVRNCLAADESVKVIGLADAFEYRVKSTAAGLRKEHKDRVDLPDDRLFVGLNAYIDAIDCGPDMVLITTPPGFRPSQYAAAVKAGKNVFMEKPCCVDGAGYRSLLESNKLADAKGLKVGVGLQRHHQAGYQETVKRIHDGALGELMLLRAYWNGGGIWNRSRADLARRLGREPTEMEYQINNWYHFCWLSGDNITEQHIHNLDVCNWVKNDHPAQANGMGGCELRYRGSNRGTGQIFDHHFVEFTYGDGTKLYSQCRHMKGCWSNVSEAVLGTKGTSNCSRSIDGENKWRYRGGGRNPYEQEHVDLIAAIRGGQQYNEAHYGATSSMTSVLGRMATYSGQVVQWDDATAKGTTEFPKVLAWDAEAPVQKDADGDYPIPVPGVYEAYPS